MKKRICFYSVDDEPEYEDPMTHSKARVLAKVNTLMDEHFNTEQKM